VLVRLTIVALAVAAALVPLPRWAVEHWYSQGLYPAIQSYVTPATNRVPVALLDVTAAVLLIWGTWRLVRALRASDRLRALAKAAGGLLTFACASYLLFLVLWGLNYQRVPLREKLELDESRVTQDAAVQFATAAVSRINALYPQAHMTPPPGRTLEEAFARAQIGLGASRPAVAGIPKRSVLEAYFRSAAIDGMTDPFFLEIIVNPEVLPIEQPFVLAHEWAHLAGYADESEANLVAWLTCLGGDALAEYSGWMAMFGQVVSDMPRESRRQVFRPLAPGPRADFDAIAARWTRSRPVVRNVARDTYDIFLRANRVEAGIESYDQVVRLILGAGAEHGWAPRLRHQ
jgi:hypothetical protein